MATTEVYEIRRKVIESLVADEPAVVSNGYEIPKEPARYLVVELYGRDVMWANDEATLEDCAQWVQVVG